jgi:TRAP-type mannitol/chloroaromatic compound transport system permease small subunit
MATFQSIDHPFNADRKPFMKKGISMIIIAFIVVAIIGLSLIIYFIAIHDGFIQPVFKRTENLSSLKNFSITTPRLNHF